MKNDEYQQLSDFMKTMDWKIDAKAASYDGNDGKEAQEVATDEVTHLAYLTSKQVACMHNIAQDNRWLSLTSW